MAKKIILPMMAILILVSFISILKINNQNEQDLLEICNDKTKIDIIQSIKWNKYLNELKIQTANNKDQFRIHQFMIEGYDTTNKRNSEIFNKVRPLTIIIKDSSGEIARINTFEIEIKKWYLSGNRWSSCPQAYSSIFYNSTFN